jgi:YVTN family beta-propeller protein
MLKYKKIKAIIIAISLFLVGITFFSSCEKQENNNTFPDIMQGNGVFIINEGNYGWGNASLGYIDKIENKGYHKLFDTANSRPLGDVFQSISLINGQLFLVINNSGKIEVVDPVTIESITTIEGLTSPRKIAEIGNNKALITDLYSNKISVLNLDDFSISAQISVSGWTEDIYQTENKIFISNTTKNLVYIIDKNTLQITDSIETYPMPGSMLIDNVGKLWVACSGIPEENLKGALQSIDTETHTITNTIEFNATTFANIAINKEKSTIYLVNEHVWKIDLSEAVFPQTPFISSEGRLLYGINIDSSNNDIYLSDAIDYVQRGKVMQYNLEGVLKNTYDAGIIPSGFFFY